MRHIAVPQEVTTGAGRHSAEPRRPAHSHIPPRHLRLRAANEKRAVEPPIDSANPPPQRPARRAFSAVSAATTRPPSRPEETGTSPTPAADRAGSFNDLLTHLTGRPQGSDHPSDRASGEALTPPPPGAPDPFAARPPDQ
jgi:hypothetical protein